MAHMVRVAGLSTRVFLSLHLHHPCKLGNKNGFVSLVRIPSTKPFPGAVAHAARTPFRFILKCSPSDSSSSSLSSTDAVLLSSKECPDGSILFKFGSPEQHVSENAADASMIDDNNGAVTNSHTPVIDDNNGAVTSSHTSVHTGADSVLPTSIKEIPEFQCSSTVQQTKQTEKEEQSENPKSVKDEVARGPVENHPTVKDEVVRGPIVNHPIASDAAVSPVRSKLNGPDTQGTASDLQGFTSINPSEETPAVVNSSAAAWQLDEGKDLQGLTSISPSEGTPAVVNTSAALQLDEGKEKEEILQLWEDVGKALKDLEEAKYLTSTEEMKSKIEEIQGDLRRAIHIKDPPSFSDSDDETVQNKTNDAFIVEDIGEATAIVENNSEGSQESADSKEELGTTATLRLRSGSAMRPHPNKLATGGEDAYLVEGTSWVGVADGVGGWASEGIDAGIFSREFMSNCGIFARKEQGIPNPKNVIIQSVYRSQAVGTCTAVLAALHNQTLYVANIGDSGFVVVRNGEVLARSTPMQRGFNFPYQIGSKSEGDHPSIAETYEVSVGAGDVVVLGTDGLYDNLYECEIVNVIQTAVREAAKPQDVAMWLVKLAHLAGIEKSGRSPFSDAAAAAGYSYTGGKLDDVTVVVSYVE